MRSGTIAFLFGVLLPQGLAELPGPGVYVLLPLALLVIGWLPRCRALGFFLLGVLWACYRAGVVLAAGLPTDIEGMSAVITGRVAGLPERVDGRLRFEFDTETLTAGGHTQRGCGRVRLDWRSPPALHPGETWRLTVRLKQPHGMRNPGGFDYERWLFQRRVRATGYVLDSGASVRLAAAPPSIDGLRELVRDRLAATVGHDPQAGVLTALAIGARDGISPDQWRVFFRTGVGHLMAISGLHIGLLAGFGYFLGRWLWSLPILTLLYVPAPRIAAVTALVAAAGYAALAGLEVPAQRTVVMIAAVLAASWTGHRSAGIDTLLVALLAVLILDPLAVLQAGFWLSFVAVALLMYSTGGPARHAGLWWRLGRAHVAMAIGLMPLSMILFEQNPVLGPVANLVAVPWVSFVVVPMTLIGTAVLPFSDFSGYWLLRGALLALDLLWAFLVPIADLDFAVWRQPMPGPMSAASAVVGVLILLLPHGLPSRWIGLLWLAPALLSRPAGPQPGEVWMTVLDVGQGLAVVARTSRHTLVFDTGPKWSERFDTGSSVLVPYLRHVGVGAIDTLVISHGDNDHIGGAAGLRREIEVGAILSSVAERLPAAVPCAAGQSWNWDGVGFAMLHPEAGAAASENDRSCVLRIRSRDYAVLLPGDIEAGAERQLLARYGDDLRAAVLIAPHHGSRTSSTPAFLRAVRPDYVVYPAGYRNRYRHPHPEIRDRYRDLGAQELVTGAEGAVEFRPDPGRPPMVSSWRRQALRYWHDRDRPDRTAGAESFR